MRRRFSLSRIVAMTIKEFIQIWRDRGTASMIFILPVMQLVLFGYAINSDPKHLATAFVIQDQSSYVRTLVAAMQNSGYFNLSLSTTSEREAERLLQTGEVQFIVTFPTDFTRDLLRGEKPTLLVQADSTDPVAVANALASLSQIHMNSLNYDLTGNPSLLPKAPPYQIKVHKMYNPEGLASYNIVPGLLAVLLTMTLVALTAVAVTRERERGTMENLLATPLRPLEVMIGKIAPFIIIAYIQMGVILLASWVLFRVPILGNPLLLVTALSAFIAANLSVGFMLSTFARNQLQAIQMTMFFFLPSMLLSGFMFPFSGMPTWAQHVGNVLPMTHALRIIRGVVLKGITAADVWPHIWPMLLFTLFVAAIAMKRYRETID